jgi:hypothetical protein
MAWAKSKQFLEKLQLGSIILYLICLGGYIIPAVAAFYATIRADILGFTFFSLFIASTILLSFEEDPNAQQETSTEH